ncbi:aspartate aminotransferase family protein [Orrella daihaiensis]|uniref:Aspartate aminotransferase family protein n=1 Tax=Orrella daihaiensis TaxID=2782176 RepID=A0ABY4AJX7_9BURK|nr:aspartate aminotransferase family protein [Orrella daihaiensis]UOD50586.1 aspartate aminotransferase family protein [Orrella daihaiensis]
MNNVTDAKHLQQAQELDLSNFWMPFTANKQFKAAPRLFKKAKGMYYTTVDDRQVIDAVAGLWCVNAGHCREEIAHAIANQASEMDYAPTFQMGHPLAFEAASRVAEVMPAGMDRIFFANSGSEAVDSALKIALAYHRARGEGQRTRLIGRERGYHGVGFGGISVGGIVANRKAFSANLIPGVDHMPATLSIEHAAFSRGQPAWGAHLADELERILNLHDPSTVAAVIVEPVAGSAGVLIPPQGYLQRLREICTKHGILLIFDEVITGFGRLGKATASEYFGVTPDLLTMAKAINNAAIPMGAVAAKREIYDTIVNNGPANGIELFHGYTYSAHPVAAAACLAAQDIYEREALFERAAQMAPKFEAAIHDLKGEPYVKDIRNLGLVGGVELESREGQPGTRAYDAFLHCFKNGVMVRFTGDILAFSPPLILDESHIDQIFSTVRAALRAVH